MANCTLQPQQHIFHYRKCFIDKSQPLGHGSYGAVYKAKCDQLPCAAKLIHATILDPTDPGADKIMQRFQQECAFLDNIRHPNIVQYLGMTVDPDSRLPALLMELLDESLAKMLESSQQPLPYCVQVDICHDISLAVAYLHSNDIIHRDLSSNNVLMIARRRAKVTDFGMSKLAVAVPTMTPLTMCPGTFAYMAPEALREPPTYTKKLDCFSEGVIMIQVCTRLWPEPGPRTQLVADSRFPTGTIEVPMLETERRKNHIDLINPTHALLPIAIDCLKYQEEERPSSEELCQRLAALKESCDYRDSVQEHYDVVQTKDIQLRDKDNQLQQQRKMHDEVMTQHQKEKQELHAQLQSEIASRERQLRHLNQKIEKQDQVTAEIQQTNHSLQRQVEELQRQLSLGHKPHAPKTLRSLEWRDGGKAPCGMCRGSAVVDGDVAYFMNWNGGVCSYNSTSKKWYELPEYPYQRGTLAVFGGQLTGIGGCEDYSKVSTYTDKLLSLSKNWSAAFTPMPTMRRYTTAIVSKEHLIVAGGSIGPHWDGALSTMEVIDTKSQVWSTVASLPHPYCLASSAICGDGLYMLGGTDDKGKTKSVLTCSLTELLQSSSSSSSPSIWHRVADTPAYQSTLVAVNEELLAVGGQDEEDIASAAVHKYNPKSNSWDLISNMPTARYRCLVGLLPTNEIITVGGLVSSNSITNKVEIASCSFA